MHNTRELQLKFEVCKSSDAQPIKLSPRGKEILELFMYGFTYKVIAERLGISLSGVRRHREKMLWQNDCTSMLELIARYHGQEQGTSKENRYPSAVGR